MSEQNALDRPVTIRELMTIVDPIENSIAHLISAMLDVSGSLMIHGSTEFEREKGDQAFKLMSKAIETYKAATNAKIALLESAVLKDG